MRKFTFGFCSLLFCGAANAQLYISGKIGATDFVINTDQYMYYSDESYRSTIASGNISDINATYYGAVGFEFDERFRLEAEYSYGKYIISGNWALNTKNYASGEGVTPLPPNISYPSTFELTNKVHSFMLNGYFNVFTFDRRYRNHIYGEEKRKCCYDAMYVMFGVGMAHMADTGRVGIDTTMAWGGNPLSETVHNTLERFIFGAGAGLSFGLTPNFNLDVSYRFTKMGKYDIGQTRRDYYAHSVMMGARLNF